MNNKKKMIQNLIFTTVTAVLTLALVCLMTPAAKADHVQDQSSLATPEQLVIASTQTVYDRVTQIDMLTVELHEKIQGLASEQAEIWGDNILEGEYEADGKTVVDRVEELKVAGELVAYRVTYSQRAWETSLCTYPGNLDLSALSQCQEGRISESSFVSPDLKTYTRDPSNFANFN